MKDNDAGIISEQCKKSNAVTNKTRLALFNVLVDFLIEKCGGMYPNIVTKTAFAQAIITLFPVFKDENDGIVSCKH